MFSAKAPAWDRKARKPHLVSWRHQLVLPKNGLEDGESMVDGGGLQDPQGRVCLRRAQGPQDEQLMQNDEESIFLLAGLGKNHHARPYDGGIERSVAFIRPNKLLKGRK